MRAISYKVFCPKFESQGENDYVDYLQRKGGSVWGWGVNASRKKSGGLRFCTGLNGTGGAACRLLALGGRKKLHRRKKEGGGKGEKGVAIIRGGVSL